MMEDLQHMTRSFKKNPGFYDRSPFFKAKANEKVRHCKDLQSGMAYKNVSESWNIHDYKFHIWSRSDLINWRNRFGLQEKWLCFKDLCKSKLFREAKSK
jgi:hypothetical protein